MGGGGALLELRNPLSTCQSVSECALRDPLGPIPGRTGLGLRGPSGNREPGVSNLRADSPG